MFFVLTFFAVTNSLVFFRAFSEVRAQGIDPSVVIQQRANLQAELSNLESQIRGFQKLIETTENQAQSLGRDIALLDAQIKKAKLEIKARTIAIQNLQGAINDRSKHIGALDEKMDRERESIAELMRRIYEIDQTPLIQAMLAYNSLSDYFFETDSADALQEAVQDSFNQLRQDRSETEQEKNDLEDRKAEEAQLKALQEIEQKRIQQAEAQKQQILTVTKGQEKAYQKLLADKAKSAATIRSQLFILNGSPSIPFERALEYAQLAEKNTGIRPAFLLGIITEESNLGQNVGTGNWSLDLADARCAKQRTAFMQITSALGLNPDLMPVSKKAWYGYCGGAMGPAQFIPTTWLLYQNGVAQITANNPPNPWDPKDALIASALLLRDNGGAGGNAAGERKAALKYLAGSNWAKPAYSFYGDDVMAIAQKYQDQINLLREYASR